jgi:hypothetical protein
LGSLVPKAEQNTNHSQAAFVGHSVIPRESLTVKSQERPQDKVRVDQAQSAGWGRR